MAFTETRLSNDTDIVQFDGFDTETMFRNDRRGGGVALYVKVNVMYKVVTQFTIRDPNYESLVINCLDTIVAVIYRPPSGSVGLFLEFV